MKGHGDGRSSSQSDWATARKLSRRLLRNRRVKLSALTLFVASIATMAMYVVLDAQTLTGPETADRDLGRFDAYAGFAAAFPAGSPVGQQLESRVAATTSAASAIALTAVDVSIPALSSKPVTYFEMRWDTNPFPRRFRLLTGRWPTSPGEVAVVNPAPESATGPGTTLRGYGERLSLQVVGTVDDVFARDPSLLGGWGSWQRLDPRLGTSDNPLSIQPVAYWNGQNADAVLAGIVDIYHANHPLEPSDDLPQLVADSYRTRAQVESNSGQSWLLKSPAGYLVPSILLPLFGTLLAFALCLRLLAGRAAVMISIGVRRSVAVRAGSLAVTVGCVIAATSGAVIGTLGGFAAAWVMARKLSDPDPGIPHVWSAATSLFIVTAIGCFLGAALLRRQLTQQLETPPAGEHIAHAAGQRQDRTWPQSMRRLAAVAAGCGVIVQVGRLDSGTGAMFIAATIAAGLVLLAPDIVPRALQLVPARKLRTRLSLRQLLADTHRVVAAVTILSVLIGTAIGFITLLDTMVRTASDQTHPDVLPGQIELAEPGSDVLPAPPATQDALASVAAIQQQTPVTMRFLLALDGDQAVVRAAGFNGAILAVDSADDLTRLLGRTLPDTATQTLQTGGITIWEQAEPARDRVDLRIQGNAKPARLATSLPAAHLDVAPTTWNTRIAGAVLTATAQRLQLPVTAGAKMYTGLSAAQAEQVRSALADASIDPRVARIFETPPAPIPPLALTATAIGLFVIALGVASTVAASQTTALRGYLAHLIALGIPVKWTRRILLGQQAILLSCATAIGLTIATPPVLLAAAIIPDWSLGIPWTQLAIALTAIYAACLTAALTSGRKLRANQP